MQAPSEPIRVMLVDCRPLVLMGLHDLINARKPRMEVIGQATNYGSALDAADQLRPDVILLSFFADVLDPLQTIARLVRDAGMNVLVFKGRQETVPIAQVIEAGACGVVLAEDPTESIILAILKAQQRKVGLDGERSAGRAGRASDSHADDPEQVRQAQLTLRERELIRAIVGQPSAKYISVAERMGISEHTVHNHLSNIYHKLNLINRIDLLMYALKHGLSSDEQPPDPTQGEMD